MLKSRQERDAEAKKRVFRIIGIKAEKALRDYKILDIEEYIRTASVTKIQTVLNNKDHVFHKKYWRTNPRTGKQQPHVPAALTEKYKNSIVPTCLRIIRDGTATLYAETEPTKSKPIKSGTKVTSTPTIRCQLCAEVGKVKLCVSLKGLAIHQRSVKCGQKDKHQKKKRAVAAKTKTVANTLTPTVTRKRGRPKKTQP